MSFPSLDTALYQKLASTSGVTSLVGGTASPRIYEAQAPAGTSMPYVIFYLASGITENDNPSQGINDIYRVEARATSRASADALLSALHDALHRQDLTVSGWTNFYTSVERRQNFVDTVSSQQFWRRILDVRFRLDD